MRRTPRPPVPDHRPDWQKTQGAACPCRGADEYCACQNVDRTTSDGFRDFTVRALATKRAEVAALEGALAEFDAYQAACRAQSADADLREEA